MLVGGGGVGTLNILDGGYVSSANGTVSEVGDIFGDMLPSVVNINGAGSTWDVSGGLALAGTGSSANSATFENAVVTVENGGALSVGGTINVWGGSSVLIDGGNLDVDILDLSAPDGTESFSFLDGTLSVGEVLGSMIQDGGVLRQNGAALTSFNDDYQLNNGTIEIELGGLNRGTEFDAIDVAGIALLNNVTIEVSFIDGCTVTFDFSGAGLESPSYWDTSRFVSDGIITAVPEPASMALLVAFGGLFAIRRKKAL